MWRQGLRLWPSGTGSHCMVWSVCRKGCFSKEDFLPRYSEGRREVAIGSRGEKLCSVCPKR